MAESRLSLRQLNRTLLTRQMLLDRQDMRPVAATERLIALQSQIPNPPYIGLWTRLRRFERRQLTALLESREIVRAPWIRSTLHLVSAEDHQRFQSVIQPALLRGLRSFFGARGADLDIERLLSIAKPFLESNQPSIGALRAHLQEHQPTLNKEAMAYAVRSCLPLVQIPPGGTWGAGTRATYTTAAKWLGRADSSDLTNLFRRYLAAFGPADVMDFQTWTGMTRLKSQLAPALADLVVYQSENGPDLYDLPAATIAAPDSIAPLRFIPEYDNILIAHRDRSRILPDAHRKKVFLSAGRVIGAVLIDGFVGATWKVKKDKNSLRLFVTLFEAKPKACLRALEEEGNRLLRFFDDEANNQAVVIDTYD
ncbi:MAG: winged helix DNA-binding domain-containing protein [Chloroflexota bacterium]|nr:winged helix DNA-binding domain-containing protein [Chloroflexota bacterium]